MFHPVVSLVLFKWNSLSDFFFPYTFFFFFKTFSQKYLNCKSNLYTLPNWFRASWNRHLLSLSKSHNAEGMSLDGHLWGLLHCLCYSSPEWAASLYVSHGLSSHLKCFFLYIWHIICILLDYPEYNLSIW